MNKEDYKQKIKDLVDKCDNIHWLKTIYTYIKTLLK